MSSTNTAQTTLLSLSAPPDILAAVPYLLGYHPAQSLIALGLSRRQVQIAARWDLPLSQHSLAPFPAMLARERITELIVVGYGPGILVTPAVDTMRELAAKAGVPVAEALRAEETRFWSYLCDAPACCPVEGTPFDITTTQVAAEATVHGLVALPDRAMLEATISPATGPIRLGMRRATSDTATALVSRLVDCRNPDRFADEYVTEALTRVRSAMASPERLSDRQVAELGFDLAIIRVRDEAWTCMQDAHLPLWRDLTRRLEPRFVPPAASLLAMAAWRSGDCVLAAIALERALRIDPTYSMAHLLRHALEQLLPPKLLTDRLPTSSDLDTAMGSPKQTWLIPLLGLLDDQSSDDPP
ncbi:MAG: DUF4192 domain-containing protein [Thermoactinospora sp.]|nr:DUF4192 domain-containing protein [Thermoactinospora sp.]